VETANSQLDAKLEAKKAKQRERSRKYREANREKVNERAREYNAKHPEKAKERKRKHYELNREKFREYREANRKKYREYHLKREYGLSLYAFNSIMEEQGKKCLVCRSDFSAKGKRKPVVDHCHETGATRGILCHDCNTTLGQIRSKLHYRQLGRYLYGRDFLSAQDAFI
jgi:hypothetical protein